MLSYWPLSLQQAIHHLPLAIHLRRVVATLPLQALGTLHLQALVILPQLALDTLPLLEDLGSQVSRHHH